MAHEQLALLQDQPLPWVLDPHVREVGRRGLHMARQALSDATPATAGSPAVRRSAERAA